MKTQWTARVRLTALAAAGLALTGLAVAPVRADTQAGKQPVTTINSGNGKMGPGLGSVKTPFMGLQVGQPQSGVSDDTLYFHTDTGQAVQQTPLQHMGPGLSSSKSPFCGRADSTMPQ